MPLVSVLIPNYRRERSLESLLEPHLPEGFSAEIVPIARHSGTIADAIQRARGDFAVLEHLEGEYPPAEYVRLIAPLSEGRADAVFTSTHQAFRLSLVKSIPLRSGPRGVASELAVKLAQRGACIQQEGAQKPAFLEALRWRLTRDIYLDGGAKILDALAHTPRFNRWMASVISPYLGRRVLEIGAGIGNLTLHLCPGRERYTATDYEPEHLARLRTRLSNRPNLEIRTCNVESPADFQPLSTDYDSVVCLNVLEHVGDDLQALRNMRSVLVPGGKAIVLVPHDPNIYGTLDSVLGHCRRYTEEGLRSTMEHAGFEVGEILRFNRITRPGWVLNGRILKRTSFGRVQLWWFEHLVWLAKRVDPLLPWPSVSIIAIGVKR